MSGEEDKGTDSCSEPKARLRLPLFPYDLEFSDEEQAQMDADLEHNMKVKLPKALPSLKVEPPGDTPETEGKT